MSVKWESQPACMSGVDFGKEEHSNPALEPSALRDQIEDLIAANVKPECLQKPDERAN